METAKLKKLAQFARRSLIEQVSAKLKIVLAENGAARRERAEAIKGQGKEQVIERVAYILFNRFCALRFMDVNRYTRIGVVSPAEGQFQPEILAEAKIESGFDAYKSEAKSICSEFRILLERMVEYELMSDVVQRYRRAINTVGKISNLAKISETDCKYFDDLMTKYSRYEHSQPLEAPVTLPEPDELETDFNGLKQWQTEFKNRHITPVLQEPK